MTEKEEDYGEEIIRRVIGHGKDRKIIYGKAEKKDYHFTLDDLKLCCCFCKERVYEYDMEFVRHKMDWAHKMCIKKHFENSDDASQWGPDDWKREKSI